MSASRWLTLLCIVAGLLVFFAVTAVTGEWLVGLREAGRTVKYIAAVFLIGTLASALIRWMRGAKTKPDAAIPSKIVLQNEWKKNCGRDRPAVNNDLDQA